MHTLGYGIEKNNLMSQLKPNKVVIGAYHSNLPCFLCHNRSFGLVTKAKACKGAGQEGSLKVTSHALESVGKCEGMNPHTPKWVPKIESSKSDYKGQNPLDWKVPYIIGKLLDCRCLKWARMNHFKTPRTKWHLGVGPMARYKVYYKASVVASPKFGPWWILWIRVYTWLVHAPKCSTYALTNLLFCLCKFRWVIKLLVNLPSPILELQHAFLPPKCYEPVSMPQVLLLPLSSPLDS